jgi:hypothetical protein
LVDKIYANINKYYKGIKGTIDNEKYQEVIVMRITIDIDEKEIIADILESLLNTDKPAMKHILRSVIKEIVLSLDKKTAKIIAEKYVEIEHEINYQARD